MGKSSAPATPDYVGAAQATANSNKYNTISPYASSSWSLRPGADPNNPQPGDYIQSTTLSPGQQQIFDQNQTNDLAGSERRYDVGLAADQALKDYQGGTQGFQNAVYDKETQYYDRRFAEDQAALESKLAGQGIAPGSEAYNREMSLFNQNKNDAYARATNDAITGADSAQNNATARLAQLLGSSATPGMPGMPGMGSGMGGGADILDAMGNQYQSELGAVNAENAQSGQTWGNIGSIATMALMFY